MLLITLARALDLWRQLLFPSPFPGIGRYLYRLVLGTLLLPVFGLLQLCHGLGFALDELLFRGYRRVEIRQPVFVLGVPRSGTTRTHRLLAEDRRFTTFATWECLFAPSISERHLFLAIAALDRRLGGPLHALASRLERRLFGSLDALHPTSLTAPEEDYLALLPTLYCFVMVVPFPGARWLWQMGRFDRDLPPADRRRVIASYRRCLQRHLYVHGTDKILLSKNAAFAGMGQALAEAFPDSRLVICERDALQVIGSQFNALAPALRLCGVREDDPHFRRNLLECLEFYYQNLDRLRLALPPQRCFCLDAPGLARNSGAVRADLYRALGLGRPPLPSAQDTAGEHAAHLPVKQPPLARWGLEGGELQRRFAPWCRAEMRL